MTSFEPWRDEPPAAEDASVARSPRHAPRFDPFGDDREAEASRPSARGQSTAINASQRLGVEWAARAAASTAVPVVQTGLAENEGLMMHAATAPPSEEPRAALRILTVCTGNVCRSPYMERKLAHLLAGSGVEVRSAGTGALVGRGIDRGSAALLEAAGISAGEFAARRLDASIVEESDLILTATREHRSAVVRESATGLRKTFALLDLADLVAELKKSDVETAAGENPLKRLADAAMRRRGSVAVRPDEDASIVDPFRRQEQVFAQMQRETDPGLETVARAVLMALEARHG